MARHVKVDRRRFGMVCTPRMMRELVTGMPALATLGWTDRRTLQHDLLDASVSDHGDRNDSVALVRRRAVDSILPEDLVLAIFELATQTQPPGTVFRLAGICSRWRAYTLNYPRLWTHIDAGFASQILEYSSLDLAPRIEDALNRHTVQMVQLQVLRSKNLPLHINVRFGTHSKAASMVGVVLAAAQRRWHSVVLQVRNPGDIDTFFVSCLGPSTLLEKLTIIVDGSQAPATFTGRQFAAGLLPCPALRIFECTECAPLFSQGNVSGLSGDGHPDAFPSLTSLHLCFPPTAIRGPRWQRLLQALPRLQNLRLSITNVAPHAGGFIAHPTVRTFYMDASAAGLTVLSHFAFPRLQRFTLAFPLLELRRAHHARSALYRFLDNTPTPHLVFQWVEANENVSDPSTAFEEFCSVVFSTSGLTHLTVEMQGHQGPWLRLLKYLDQLTSEMAQSLGAPGLHRLEMVFKSLHPWSELPWLPLEELVHVAEEFPKWEIVLLGAGKREFALWTALEEPGRFFTEFSLSKWM